MEVSAQIVTLSPDAPAKLVEAIAGGLPAGEASDFQKECGNLVANAMAPELIRKLVTQSEVIFALESVQDIEGCYSVLFSLLYKTSNLDTDLPALAKDIADAILGDGGSGRGQVPDPKAALRLRIATNLCNTLPSRSSVQFEVLLKIIKYAAGTGLLVMLKGLFEGLDEWLEGWKLSLQDQRRLYLLIADVHEIAGDDKATQRFLLKYLSTFDGSTVQSQEQAEARKAAARAAIGAVKAPIESFMQRRNVLGMSAVQSLEKDAEYGKIHELLRIFSEDKLSSYVAFAKANGAFLEKHAIDQDECVANMRLLSLCSLAAENDEIPYGLIVDTLQIGGSEVEEWVLKACASGLMQARMDQLEQVVLVSQYTSRVFGLEQWKALQAKLRMWDSNVSSLLATIRRSNAAAAVLE